MDGFFAGIAGIVELISGGGLALGFFALSTLR
jgi:hypothetical protein